MIILLRDVCRYAAGWMAFLDKFANALHAQARSLCLSVSLSLCLSVSLSLC
eukprot:COSAG03_NODE_597_length_6804_cov_5.259359_8_plen_50_part_01